MHSLQKQFHDFIKKKVLLNKEDYVLLAISGGLDSMVMADLFLKAEWKFSVAHCNFNLRGNESNGDELFVKTWANENGVEFFVKQFDLGKGSVQLKAREARYKWFEELSNEHGFNKIVTAHHLNDSLETSLINFTRGSGVTGLSGIDAENGKIVRPLLFATKEQLKDYAGTCALEWREDSSNSKTDYDRNHLRLEVIPKLEELNPSLIQTFENTSERLQLASELIKSKVEEIKGNHLIEGENTSELKLNWVKSEIDLLILSEILSEYGFGYSTSKQIYNAIGKSGKQFYSNQLVLSIDRNSLFIKSDETQSDDLQIVGEGDYDFNGSRLTISIIDPDEVNFSEGSFTAYFDADLINFPLNLRVWQDGDRFRPLGMKGTKKVSDYLIDKKVPVALKDEVLVLSSNEKIVWLVGYQISEEFKITEKTDRVLKAIINT